MNGNYFTPLINHQAVDSLYVQNHFLSNNDVYDETRKHKKRVHREQPAEIITHDEHQASIRDSPSYFLGLFLDSEVTAWLRDEAVRNGEEQKSFVPPTEEEIRCFVAILYLSGYVDVPRRRMLWERSPDTHCSLVSNAMQRDRFESIFTSLNDRVEGFDRIRPLIDLLNAKFLRNSPVDEQHSVAENTISTSTKAKGPGKFLKVWCGCASNGYCSYFTPSMVNDGPVVILRYAQSLGRYTSLSFENVYYERRLVEELGKVGVQAIGIVRDTTCCLLNPALGGVDRLNCNVNLYRTSIKGRKAYSALLKFGLDLMLNNAWHLYKSATLDKKPLDLLGFRRNVVVYYLEHYAKPILGHKGGRPARAKPKASRRPASDARFDGIRHYVIPQDKQTRCAKCTAKTTTRCQKCDIGVHVKCFVEFHTRTRET